MITRTILILIFTPVISGLYSQSRGIVKDSLTQEPVPFVNIWVEDESTGTTSNAKGEYFFTRDVVGKTIVLSSIGYKRKAVVVTANDQVILVRPEAVYLQQVVVKSKRGKSKRTKVGDNIRMASVKRFFFCDESPYMAARHFAYQENYVKTPYLAGLEIVTSSRLDSAQFNIRLYSVSENGEPGPSLYAGNILGRASKGVNLTTVDLSDRNILFPANGLFVVFEFLIVPSNRYEFTLTQPEGKKVTAYMPAFGTVPGTEEGSWIYSGGKWEKVKLNKGVMQKDYEGKYSNMAVRLMLTD